MKTVLKKNPLYESFDFENEDINIESEIPIYRYKKFLEDIYDISGSTKFREVDGKFIVDVNGSVRVKNTAITSLVVGNLEFGYVSGNFFCTNCNNLISLKGSPKIVKGGFYCWECDSLKTLEGAPKSVKEFSCSDCPSLETLEGGPKIVAGIYACMGCNSLTTLKGAPDFVGSDFTCKGCKNLISFEGMPKEIKGKFRSGKFKKIKLTESFDFNSEEDEDFKDIIELHRYKKFLEDNYYISGTINARKKNGTIFIDVVLGDVILKNKNLSKLTNGNFKFGIVSGNFDCGYSNIDSLEGSPEKVYGTFCCHYCANLTSLKGSPKVVSASFSCYNTNIKNLIGAPKKVGWTFDCSNCPISSLEGSPKLVEYIFCYDCRMLTSLKGVSDMVKEIYCHGCNSLKDESLPKNIKITKSLSESFDFNSDETEDFDEIISSSKWFALIKKAVQESVEISIEKNVPGKIFPYAIRENTKKLSKVIKPLRNLIKIVNPSNDVILNFQLDHPLGGVQISYWIKKGPNKLNTYIDSIYPAAPMYIGEFIYKIYLAVLHNFDLIRNLSEFTTMIKEETKILYSL